MIYPSMVRIWISVGSRPHLELTTTHLRPPPGITVAWTSAPYLAGAFRTPSSTPSIHPPSSSQGGPVQLMGWGLAGTVGDDDDGGGGGGGGSSKATPRSGRRTADEMEAASTAVAARVALDRCEKAWKGGAGGA